MSTVASRPIAPAAPPIDTVAELLRQLGDIPPQRVRMRPLPGTATEKDVIAARSAPERWLCELADGTLIDKAYHLGESLLNGMLLSSLMGFEERHDLGVFLGANAYYRLQPGVVRIPDISFVSWTRLPGGRVPDVEIADFAPDFVVELLNRNNSRAEMDRKLAEYFAAGVRMVWDIDIEVRTARVHFGPDRCLAVAGDEPLTGGDVLPGYELPLDTLFERFDKRLARSRPS